MRNIDSSGNDRKTYQKPKITEYSAADVIKLIGPAVANYGGGGVNP